MTTNPWIPHSGGPCPVDGDARVRLRFRHGGELKNAVQAGGLTWTHGNKHLSADGEIVAYRIVKED